MFRFMQPQFCFTPCKELLLQCYVFFKICCLASMYDLVCSGATFVPTSRVPLSEILVLPIEGN